MRFLSILTIISSVLITGCVNSTGSGETDNPNDPVNTNSNWLINKSEVIDGGPGKDGIPSVDSPEFTPASEVDFIGDERLVLVIRHNGITKIYPHQILDWHEVVNDRLGESDISVTYCPLTGTGIAWNRSIAGNTTEFGVSGLLFRNNLIAYDRATDSYWSQMQMRSVAGDQSGLKAETRPVFETKWSTVKAAYPTAQVLNTDTGYQRNYSGFAYGESYLTDHGDILFPIKNEDERLQEKTRVHAVITGTEINEDTVVRAYVIEDMGDSTQVINDTFEDISIVFAGNADKNFGVSFSPVAEGGTKLNFQAVQNRFPVIMKDNEGNTWDIFGEAVSGPRTGEQLTPMRSYNGYWFAVADFYENTCIYPANKKCTDEFDI